MLVAAALRFVDPRAAVDPLTGEVTSSALAGGASEADRCALEHALRIAEAAPRARCVAVTVGPAAADAMLRDALAAGAGAVLRVDGGPADDVSGERTARLLLGGLAATHGLPDVVVCGDRSADRGTGTTPAFVAALRGCAQALGLTALAAERADADPGGGGSDTGGLGAGADTDADAGRDPGCTNRAGGSGGVVLVGTRRLDGGRREHVRLSSPAVVSVEPAVVRLRRASLPAAIAARRAAVPVVTVEVPADPRVRITGRRPLRPRPRTLLAPDSASAHERMLALSGALASHEPPRLVTPETPADAARELLDHLRATGHVS